MKTWLACDLHVDYLREFLDSRDFPLVVSPLVASPLVAKTEAGPA